MAKPSKGPVALVKAKFFKLPVAKRSETLHEIGNVYDVYSKDAFGSELQADAMLLWIILRIGTSRDWEKCRPDFDELRNRLTKVFENQEPFRSAVQRLNADPASVDPQELLNEIRENCEDGYNALMVRQNAGIDWFLAWTETKWPEFSAYRIMVHGYRKAERRQTALALTRRWPNAFGRMLLLFVTITVLIFTYRSCL